MKEKNVRLFADHKIYSETELHARYEILLENYSKVLRIEALTMLDMVQTDILPGRFGLHGKARPDGSGEKEPARRRGRRL